MRLCGFFVYLIMMTLVLHAEKSLAVPKGPPLLAPVPTNQEDEKVPFSPQDFVQLPAYDRFDLRINLDTSDSTNNFGLAAVRSQPNGYKQSRRLEVAISSSGSMQLGLGQSWEYKKVDFSHFQYGYSGGLMVPGREGLVGFVNWQNLFAKGFGTWLRELPNQRAAGVELAVSVLPRGICLEITGGYVFDFK